MRKLASCKKAVIVPLTLIIVAVVIVAGVAFFVSSGSSSTSYWETETDFGMWKDEITIVYADGTTESFKLISENMNNPFMIYYEGDQKISSAIYTVFAEVTGEGFDGAEIKFEDNFRVFGSILAGSQNRHNSHTSEPNGVIQQISIGSTVEIASHTINLEETVEDNEKAFPNGMYEVRFNCGATSYGECWYRGYPDGGDWELASLPSSRSVIITVDRSGGSGGGTTGSISVTLTSETDPK